MVDDKKVSPPQWMGHPILSTDHVNDLETRAAIGEFHHHLPRAAAEQKAHEDYVKEHRERAAAHHLSGMRAAQAVGAPEDARKHYAMYDLHMKALGKDTIGAVPPEIERRLSGDGEKPVYHFKAHKGDLYALHEPTKDVAPEAGTPIAKAVPKNDAENTANKAHFVINPHAKPPARGQVAPSATQDPVFTDQYLEQTGATFASPNDQLKNWRYEDQRPESMEISHEAVMARAYNRQQNEALGMHWSEETEPAASMYGRKYPYEAYPKEEHKIPEHDFWQQVAGKKIRALPDSPIMKLIREHQQLNKKAPKAPKAKAAAPAPTAPAPIEQTPVEKSEAGRCKWRLGERRCQRKVAGDYCHSHKDHWANKIKQRDSVKKDIPLTMNDDELEKSGLPLTAPPPIAPALHSTVDGFMKGLSAIPKGTPARGKFITQHMNHGPFLQALAAHPQGKQMHAQLTTFMNGAANAGFKPGSTVAVAKTEREETLDTARDLVKALAGLLKGQLVKFPGNNAPKVDQGKQASVSPIVPSPPPDTAPPKHLPGEYSHLVPAEHAKRYKISVTTTAQPGQPAAHVATLSDHTGKVLGSMTGKTTGDGSGELHFEDSGLGIHEHMAPWLQSAIHQHMAGD